MSSDQVTEELAQKVIDELYSEKGSAPTTGERRRAERYNLMRPVSVILLDEAFTPLRSAMAGIVRNMSVTGISLLLIEDVAARYILVDFNESNPDVKLVFKPSRKSSVEMPENSTLKASFVEFSGPFVRSELNA